MSTLVANVLDWQNLRSKFAPYAAIPLRLTVGYGFLAHGLAKWPRDQKCSAPFFMREVFHCRHAYDAIAGSPFPDSE